MVVVSGCSRVRVVYAYDVNPKVRLRSMPSYFHINCSARPYRSLALLPSTRTGSSHQSVFVLIRSFAPRLLPRSLVFLSLRHSLPFPL